MTISRTGNKHKQTSLQKLSFSLINNRWLTFWRQVPVNGALHSIGGATTELLGAKPGSAYVSRYLYPPNQSFVGPCYPPPRPCRVYMEYCYQVWILQKRQPVTDNFSRVVPQLIFLRGRPLVASPWLYLLLKIRYPQNRMFNNALDTVASVKPHIKILPKG